MRVVRIPWSLIVLTLVLALGGCGFAPTSQAAVLHTSKIRPTVTVASTVLPIRTSSAIATPTRLIIPALGINAHVEQVGMLSNGDMATPTQNPWEDVGWYSAGRRPGERGSAVIDGHLDRPGGYPAIFWRLRDLHVGDKVLVTNSDGETLRFHVRGVELYHPQVAPIQDIFGNNGGVYLNLITCAGDWIPSQHQTTLRLVVYTGLG